MDSLQCLVMYFPKMTDLKQETPIWGFPREFILRGHKTHRVFYHCSFLYLFSFYKTKQSWTENPPLNFCFLSARHWPEDDPDTVPLNRLQGGNFISVKDLWAVSQYLTLQLERISFVTIYKEAPPDALTWPPNKPGGKRLSLTVRVRIIRKLSEFIYLKMIHLSLSFQQMVEGQRVYFCL